VNSIEDQIRAARAQAETMDDVPAAVAAARSRHPAQPASADSVPRDYVALAQQPRTVDPPIRLP
jgi:hypothetical protein